MRAILIALAALVLAARPLAAEAHPLGNFTVNHEADLVVRPDGLALEYAIDFAEIPTFQLRDGIAADPAASCLELSRSLAVRLDGARLALSLVTARTAFFPGQGGLETLRLDCAFRSPWPASDARTHGLDVRDDSYAERIGWREITARGDGVAIDSPLARESASARLTSYPKDALSSAPNVRAGTVRFSLDVAAATSARTAVATPVVVNRDSVTSLLDRTDLGAIGLLAAIFVALALGALHAATPGHGKTIMAAYLVGTRRSVRQALVLGLTVATSHTIGVLCLALLVLFGASALSPERVYPLASLVSAVVMLTLGVAMSRRELAHRRAHRHGHEHAHQDEMSGSGWRSLIALGLAGGLVPSASALVLLLGAIAAHRADLGVVLVGAFGVGMAATLVGVGVALVTCTRLLSRRAGLSRFAALAPTLAAAVVLVVGLGLTAQSLVALL
ncbi:MAG TPA: High-affinity nickel-transporter [Candidatus Limnocylindria bacterium]|nr:High-affinity nickel-transporter [Candidatus Limnocylindria bacterium]